VTDYTFYTLYTLAERHGSAGARSAGGLGGPLGAPHQQPGRRNMTGSIVRVS
jgi:hypothetical protein